MKYKDILIFIVFLVMNYVVTKYIIDMEESGELLSPSFFAFILPFPILFSFNFMVRKNYNFKTYFTSKFNFLTSKYHSTVSSDLPKELMFQKMIEVLNNSQLKVVYTDEVNLHILATKDISWKSWGENIYIDFTKEDGRTQMNFTSTTVLGIVSWGANEKNYHSLLFNYEESLTI